MDCGCVEAATLQGVEDAEGVEGHHGRGAEGEEGQAPGGSQQSDDPQQGADVLLGSAVVPLAQLSHTQHWALEQPTSSDWNWETATCEESWTHSTIF